MERTLKQFVADVAHLTGVRVGLHRGPLFMGVYLEDEETGNTYEVGLVPWGKRLSPADQESICRALGRPEWCDLLGLDAVED